MSIKEADLLKQWICGSIGEGKITFKLLWQGTRDGFTASKFHSLCNGKGPTLTIGVSTYPKIFGGFTSISWDNWTGSCITDTTAFIFSLTHRTKCLNEKKGGVVYPHPGYGPTFGNGQDITFRDNCNINTDSYSNGNYNYEIPQGADNNTFFAGSYNFTAKEVEVYSVIKQ